MKRSDFFFSSLKDSSSTELCSSVRTVNLFCIDAQHTIIYRADLTYSIPERMQLSAHKHLWRDLTHKERVVDLFIILLGTPD